MSDPVVELIAQEILSRIGNVTTANGFNQKLTAKRPPRLGVKTGVFDGLALVHQEEAEADDAFGEKGIGNGAQVWQQPFTIQLFSRQSDNDETAAETYLNRMWADAVKAIQRKGQTAEATWHNFTVNATDLAMNAWLTPPRIGIWEDDVATAVIEFKLTVQYRTVENDPYTAR